MIQHLMNKTINTSLSLDRSVLFTIRRQIPVEKESLAASSLSHMNRVYQMIVDSTVTGLPTYAVM